MLLIHFITLFYHLVHAANPSAKITEFESLPSKMVYFDQDKAILLQEGRHIWISNDKGQTWNELKNVPSEAVLLLEHPYDSKSVFIFSRSKGLLSRDEGSTWTNIELPSELAMLSKANFAFHAKDTNKIIIQLKICEGFSCRHDAYYTLDSFKTVKLLLSWTGQCEWAQSISPELVDVENKIFCNQWPTEEHNGDVTWKDPAHLELFSSDNFFEKKSAVPLAGGIPVLGLSPDWLVGVIKTGSGYQLVTTKDGKTFNQGIFNNLKPDSGSVAFSVLESSNSTLAVDIVSSRPGSQFPLPFGTLYHSNSNGRYFRASLEHTNRDLSTGMVDFEHIQGSIYEGVMLANTVKNWEAILNRREIIKEIASVMSFDNGRTWQAIKPPTDSGCKDCSLHLHSVTTTKNIGKVFSVTSAPGVIIGVGSVGDYLALYEDSNTYISYDSGSSWKKIMDGPHKFELLNYGSVIALIPDSFSPTKIIKYSTDGGEKFESFEVLVDDSDWLPLYTNLDKESRSLNMLLVVAKRNSRGPKYVIQLDFAPLFDRECNGEKSEGNKDLELYQLQTPTGQCVLGTKVAHYRRQASAKCSMPVSFSLDPVSPISCDCEIHDFECDDGYIADAKNNDKCVATGDSRDQPIDCKLGTKYFGSSGFKKIPGDKCSKGTDYAAKVEKDCKLGAGVPPGEPINHVITFEDQIIEIVQLKGTDISIALSRDGLVSVSIDEGQSWVKVDMRENEPIKQILPHDVKHDRVFLVSRNSIFISDDGLKSGKSGIVKMNAPDLYNGLGIPIMDFHPTLPDYYILVTGGRDCYKNKNCHSTAWFSTDGGKQFRELDTWVAKCVWTYDKNFMVPSLSKDSVFCSSYLYKDGRFGGQNVPQNPKKNPAQLKILNNNGKGSSATIVLQTNVLEFFVVDKILLAATNEPKDPIMYSSIDGQKFEKCSFPPGTDLKKSSYTILPAHSGGVFMDIVQSTKRGFEFGNLYKSTEDGRTFSKSEEKTNRGRNGKVDFISLPGIEGVDIINVVTNSEMAGTREDKKIQSRISSNAGAYWMELRGPTKDLNDQKLCDKSDWCPLHIHLPSTSQAYSGMLQPFGTSGSSGLILAVGNTGNSLEDYLSGDVFLTRDAGQTWNQVKKGPHIWAMADNGGLLVLVDSTKHVTTLSYSWDFGSSWADFQFNSKPIKVASIVAHEGSTKAFISGHTMSDSFPGAVAKFVSIQLDFSVLFKRPCDRSKNDFEIWSPVKIMNGEDRCFLGEVPQFLRRKNDTMCTIGPSFVSKIESKKTCECSISDFECDVGSFRNSAGKCEFVGNHPDQPAHCEKGTNFVGKSGYRKISISKCTGGVDLAAPKKFECDPEPNGPENVKLFSTVFDRKIVDYFYFEHSGSISLKDEGQRAYLSSTEGQSWSRVLAEAGEIIALHNDPYIMGRAFAITKSLLWVTDNKGIDFYSVTIPNPANLALSQNFLETHPTKPEWLIWIGSAGCPGDTCHSIASVSFDGGKNWEHLAVYVRTCKWAWSNAFSLTLDKTVFCSQYHTQNGDQTYAKGLKLIRSEHGNSDFDVLFDITGFALESEYLIAAVPIHDSKAVQLQVSMDGSTFFSATFPENFSVRDGYTVLPSSTGNVFLNIIQSLNPGSEYGTIVKSNWNGTYYLSVIDGVNQNRLGFVDFEKIEGLNGTMIVNQIGNLAEVKLGQKKHLVSKMTFDDGLTWSLLTAPKFDSKNREYRCGKNCFLHLHAFTERSDKKDSYSSPGSTGVMIGVGTYVLILGNVGEYLDDYSNGDTFLSRDAGRSWIEIAKKAHMIEINDHGAIILMVNDEEFVNTVKYSLDMGATFRDFELRLLESERIRIQNIIAEPTGTTRNFVLIGNLKNGSSIAINLDFDHVFSRQCEANLDEPSLSDFEEWTPNTNASCTFGAEIHFLRRKIDRDCFVGDMYQNLEPTFLPCACTFADYECDQYHVLNDANQCVPSENIKIPEPQCRNGVKFIPTGYIKKKISQCEGGKVLAPKPSTCSIGSSFSWSLIFFVLLPITAFVAYVLFRFIRGDLGRYGAISLPLDNAPQTSVERFLAILQDTVYAVIGFFAGLWSKGMEIIRARSQGSNAYIPVTTHYYDPDLPTTGSLELDWDDNENNE